MISELIMRDGGRMKNEKATGVADRLRASVTRKWTLASLYPTSRLRRTKPGIITSLSFKSSATTTRIRLILNKSFLLNFYTMLLLGRELSFADYTAVVSFVVLGFLSGCKN